jgi:hypothetical protein
LALASGDGDVRGVVRIFLAALVGPLLLLATAAVG